MRFVRGTPRSVLRQPGPADQLLPTSWVVVAALVGSAAYEVVLDRCRGPPGRSPTPGRRIRVDVRPAPPQSASGIPLVGEDLARALGAGHRRRVESLARAGTDYGDASARSPRPPACSSRWRCCSRCCWRGCRCGCATRAGPASAAARSGSPDLLALRALARAPMHRLRAVSADPAAGWRTGDPEVLVRLATLELDSLGLRAPQSRSFS